jgi:hypothetical protein
MSTAARAARRPPSRRRWLPSRGAAGRARAGHPPRPGSSARAARAGGWRRHPARWADGCAAGVPLAGLRPPRMTAFVSCSYPRHKIASFIASGAPLPALCRSAGARRPSSGGRARRDLYPALRLGERAPGDLRAGGRQLFPGDRARRHAPPCCSSCQQLADQLLAIKEGA